MSVNDFAGEHALVTGGAGFLGAHLVRELLARGSKVTVWDNLHTGREKNLAAIRTKISFSEKDIRTVEAKSVAEKFSVIFNLACPASPPHYQKDPVYTWETSVLGIRNMLQLAELQGARLLHASTSEIYGDPHVHPQGESYWGNVNTVGVRSCYDEGKRAAETLCADYTRFKGVDARLFRIFNTYGEFMHPDDGRVISNFCVAAAKGTPVPIYGDGSQTRSFCYASDLIAGILALARLPRERYDGPINLGNPGEFTIRELVTVLERITGKKLSTQNHPLPLDDPKMRRPIIERAERILGWQPKVQLEEGLRRTYDYFAAEIGSLA
ncbi:MAG: NAD-dependent epimerase/dehydratase family protein [Leptospiraceae bacterium]|nr:NAD-dependent epimerase/dehydratase family protein [Leptospiraceae bacterium]